MIGPVLHSFLIFFGKNVLHRYHFFHFMVVEVRYKIRDLLELQPLVKQQTKTTAIASSVGRDLACNEHGVVLVLYNPALVNFFANVYQHLLPISASATMEPLQQLHDRLVKAPVEQNVSCHQAKETFDEQRKGW